MNCVLPIQSDSLEKLFNILHENFLPVEKINYSHEVPFGCTIENHYGISDIVAVDSEPGGWKFELTFYLRLISYYYSYSDSYYYFLKKYCVRGTAY